MSIFRVGQRVRLLYPDGSRSDFEGTIWQIGFAGGRWSRDSMILGGADPHDTPHAIDVDGRGRCDHDGVLFALPARLLEPIAPPPVVTTWDECPWQPKEKVTA